MKKQKILSVLAAIALMSGSVVYAESEFSIDDIDEDIEVGVAIENAENDVNIKPLLSENDGLGGIWFGTNAGLNLTTGQFNSFIGISAGRDITTGSRNVCLGNASGLSNQTGDSNTFIGTTAGRNVRFKNKNTFIGDSSGGNTQVNACVFLGYGAGRTAPRDNTLYIANTDTNSPLIYGEFDTKKVGINGKLGVFTKSPAELVDVKGQDTAARFMLTSITNTSNQAAQFIQRRAHSNNGNPSAVQNGDVIGFFSFRGWNSASYTGTKAGINVTATEDWSTIDNGNQLTISHTPNQSTRMIAALQIKGHADVYIPNGNLYVKGRKMSVPDYVFKDDYKLMPLEELKVFVKKNNHLPGVASADEVDKAGVVNLSSLQMTLLEKVEELTLYTLQQEESLASKDAEIKEMQAKIAKLEAMQKRLAKVESLLTNLALDTSGTNKEKVSVNFK
ncbi:MAG: hypothetical protein U9Q90_06805 [Campylobacterota bacterium]|nr:hypothetical protein [Campylobacterota bacterium]